MLPPTLVSYLASRLHRFRTMLSRLVDIPALLPVNSVKWTVSWIFLLSICYTYFINRLGTDHSVPAILHPAPINDCYLTRAKKLRAARKARQDLQERQRQIVESSSFRFLNFPTEIALAVLAHCADWPETFISLLLVSRECQKLAFHACLPHTPVRLISAEQVHSFDILLRKRRKLTCLIHHLWVTPLEDDLLTTSVEIVKKCTNLRSFASCAYIVQEAITLRDNRPSHPDCKNFTLLSTSPRSWTHLLSIPAGLALFTQLTHLRLIGDQVPRNRAIPLPNLTHLSYGSDAPESDKSAAMSMLEDQVAYPLLRTVIVTKARGSAGGLRISRAAKARFFTFELPPARTELEIWCDSASKRGIWELCGEPLARQ